MWWTDIHSGRSYGITTADERARPDLVRVKSYRDVLSEHRHHPESKSLGPDGRACRRATRGLLSRRPVRLGGIHYIGKESNRLEDVERGAVHDLDEVLTEYVDPERDDFDLYARPVMIEMSKHVLAAATGMHPRKIAAIRNGHARPRRGHRDALTVCAGTFAKERLRWAGAKAPRDDVAACRMYLELRAGAPGSVLSPRQATDAASRSGCFCVAVDGFVILAPVSLPGSSERGGSAGTPRP